MFGPANKMCKIYLGHMYVVVVVVFVLQDLLDCCGFGGQCNMVQFTWTSVLFLLQVTARLKHISLIISFVDNYQT